MKINSQNPNNLHDRTMIKQSHEKQHDDQEALALQKTVEELTTTQQALNEGIEQLLSKTTRTTNAKQAKQLLETQVIELTKQIENMLSNF